MCILVCILANLEHFEWGQIWEYYIAEAILSTQLPRSKMKELLEWNSNKQIKVLSHNNSPKPEITMVDIQLAYPHFLHFIHSNQYIISLLLCLMWTLNNLDFLYAIPHSYKPISGFQGILSGLLVGIKQIIPDQELTLLKIKAKVWTFFFTTFLLVIYLTLVPVELFMWCSKSNRRSSNLGHLLMFP